jgi:hypothetical protein
VTAARSIPGAGTVVLFAALLAAAIGYALTAPAPILWLAYLVPLAAIAAALQTRSTRFLPLLALAVPLTPLPDGIPLLLPLGGRSMFLTDLLVPGVAVWAMRGRSPSRGADRAVQLYLLAIVVLALVGLLRGAQMSAVIQDLRGPVYIACGYVIASRKLQWSDGGAIVKVVGAILWWSTVGIVLTLSTGTEVLQGRVGATSAFLGGDRKESLDAIRFLIASKELALVTALAVIGALILRAPVRRPRRLLLGLLVPAVVVVFMAFSRQSVVGAGLAVAYLLVVSPARSQTVVRIVSALVIVVCAVGVLDLAGVTEPITAEGTVVGRQLDAYGDRVITGLFGDENATEDPGNRFRLLENEAAIDFASRNPLVGGGMGVPYRDATGIGPFNDVEYGRRYVHNVYLWYAAHGGILGVAAILVLVARPVATVLVPAFRARGGQQLVLAAGAPYAALLVIGLVEPVIHLNSTATLFGAFLGFFAHAEGRMRRAAPSPTPARTTGAG